MLEEIEDNLVDELSPRFYYKSRNDANLIIEQENWSAHLFKFLIFIIISSILTGVLVFLCKKYDFGYWIPKKKKAVKILKKWLKKKINKLNTETDEFNKLKALQISDGVAQIFYLVNEEKLVVQIKEIVNHSKIELLDFYTVVTLLKFGEVYRSLKGPIFQLKAGNSFSYNKEFVFHLLFDDIMSSSVTIQIQGVSNDKKVVASRVFIQLANFDIIYSSINKINGGNTKLINSKDNNEKIVLNEKK